MESELVDQLDEAWKRQGLKSRMDLFRVSLKTYLTSMGENELAEALLQLLVAEPCPTRPALEQLAGPLLNAGSSGHELRTRSRRLVET